METPQIPAWLSPAERMTRARASGLAPVVQRRPDPHFRPSAAEQQELDAITDRHARLTRFREMRDSHQERAEDVSNVR